MLKCNSTKSEYRSEYSKYRKLVEKITRKQPLYQLEHSHLRGQPGRKENAHHLDHILSVSFGFHNEIDAELIGSIVNLQFIPYQDNLMKSNYLEKASWDVLSYFIENEWI